MTDWVVEDLIDPAAVEEAQRHYPGRPRPAWFRVMWIINEVALAFGQFALGMLVGLTLLIATGIDRGLTPLFTLGGGFGALWALHHVPRQHWRNSRRSWLLGLNATLPRDRFVLSPRCLRVEGPGRSMELDWSEVTAVHVDRRGMTFATPRSVHVLSFHDAFTKADAERLKAQVEAWKAAPPSPPDPPDASAAEPRA